MSASQTLTVDALGRGLTARIVGVHGTLNMDRPLLSFPNVGADAMVTLPVGTSVSVTNFTLQDDYFEVTSSGQRGYVLSVALTF